VSSNLAAPTSNINGSRVSSLARKNEMPNKCPTKLFQHK